MLRQAYLRTVGHCAFNTAEQEAAITIVMHRLRTGRGSGFVSPRMLNQLAESAPGPGTGRYVSYQPPRFNRPYF